MTFEHGESADHVRASHPNWFIWRVCRRWWAVHVSRVTTVSADDLGQLAALLTERERLIPAVTP